ncbi:MAG: hypothetical protein FWB87_15530 [Defluviitaleaceae bacterium]|nr:hypothetical protein [Defluviitaleaceae bacterium]
MTHAKYVCLGYWTSKEDNKNYCSLAPVSEGVSKNGAGYAFANCERDRVIKVEGKHAVGDILTYSMTLAPTSATPSKG